jgi:hypothetical protein
LRTATVDSTADGRTPSIFPGVALEAALRAKLKAGVN